MRIAITGATGLLGGNLAEALLESGHDVVCTHRATSNTAHLDDLPIEWIEAPLGDLPGLVQAFTDCHAAFHCAALLSLRRHPTPALWRTNVQGTLNVLHAVRACGVERLVYCSSVEALGPGSGDEPVTEAHVHTPPDPRAFNGYAYTKRQALLAVFDAAARDVDAVSVSPAVMFGPRDARPSSGEMIVKVVRGHAVGWTDGANNFVDVRDVVRGMIAALERGRRGHDYILGHENATMRSMLTRIAEIAGVRPPLFRAPRSLSMLAGVAGELKQLLTRRDATVNIPVVRYLYCDGYRFSTEKARRELGYAPGPVDDAIRDALAWFRARDMI